MEVQDIVTLFSGEFGEEEAKAYLESVHVLRSISLASQPVERRIPPNYRDLARLHSVIRSRKAFTILEFGVGHSTAVMAHGLLANRDDWDALSVKPKIRNSTQFQLHAVDTASKWIQTVRDELPDNVRTVVTFHHSGVTAGTFQDRSCHFYDVLPDVVPDFIYVDGPDPRDVKGGWQNTDCVVMAADLLRVEPWLLPGTLILIDGRTANARFLASHLYRNWKICYCAPAAITAMELQEAPLGELNRTTLAYCLGTRVNDWGI